MAYTAKEYYRPFSGSVSRGVSDFFAPDSLDDDREECIGVWNGISPEDLQHMKLEIL